MSDPFRPAWPVTARRLCLRLAIALFLGAVPAVPASAQDRPAATPAAAAAPPQPNSPPVPGLTRAWRDDRTWFDGQAEMAVYDAVRVIYGKPRQYQARLYTNKEMADPETKTKSATDRGRSVFKHHLREDVPTENYTYHFSTMCYVGTSDLKSLKIDVGVQEDCGASFKQIVNHAGTMTWDQHSYFPKEGERRGTATPPLDLMFHDALPLILRGYPFAEPVTYEVSLLPDQTTSRLSSMAPRRATIRLAGRETLELPIGEVDAWHVQVSIAAADGAQPEVHDYWMHSDGSTPRLHVMVQYRGPDGSTMALRELRRWAYWEH